MNFLTKNIQRTVGKLGYEIHRNKQSQKPSDLKLWKSLIGLAEIDYEIISSTLPYTMTSAARMYALMEAVRYVFNNNISGSIVECGVWKGGSMMAVAKTLLDLNCCDIDLYLFDTFEGMTKPSDSDIQLQSEELANEKFERLKINENSSNWVRALLDEVRKNLFSTGYDKEKIHFIKGKIEETLPQKNPNKISILRLDTDWYESTLHELVHLFPLLSHGGVLIIDDYDWWKGQRKAVDEYFYTNRIKILLNKIDQSARIGVKL